MTLSLFLLVVTFAVIVWYLAAPFFQKGLPDLNTDHYRIRRRDLIVRKDEIIGGLADLDLDHQLKKIATEDYQELYDEGFRDGTQILREMDQNRPPSGSDTTRGSANDPIQYCSGCGKRLLPEGRYCAHCGVKVRSISSGGVRVHQWLWVLGSLLFLHSSAWAQSPPVVAPHMQKGVKTGVIEGRVFTKLGGQKNNVPEQAVALMVFHEGTRVLMLDKMTDANGKFQFKNIFQDPDYSYALGVIYEDVLHVISNIQLSQGQSTLDIPFQVGEGSPFVVDKAPLGGPEGDKGIDPSMVPKASQEKTPFSVKSVIHPYQKLALFLSAFVILFAGVLYFRTKKVS